MQHNTLVRRGLKLSHLRIIAALAETGQLGLAADRLSIAQPAASRLMAEIERITGAAVHERTGRGVQLTEQGQALARRAARILLEIDDAGRELGELGQGAAGHVRIGAVTGPALDHVLPAVRAARLTLPKVTVEVEVGPSDHLCDLLLSGRLDFIIARPTMGVDTALIDTVPMQTEPVSLLVRRGHHLSGQTLKDPHDLMAYDWVLPAPGAVLRRTVEARLNGLGLPLPNVRLATSSFLLTLSLIQQTNAIAALATGVCRQFSSDSGSPYAVLDIDLGIEVETFHMITRKGSLLTPAATQFRDLVLAQVTE